MFTEPFFPTKGVATRNYADDAGGTASLSPFSLVFEAGGEGVSEVSSERVVLQLEDGSEVTVSQLADDSGSGTSEENYYTSSLRDDESTGNVALVYTLTRLVDVDEVESVRVEGRLYMDDGTQADFDRTLVPTE